MTKPTILFSVLFSVLIALTLGLHSGCAGCKDDPDPADDDVSEDDDDTTGDDDDDTTEPEEVFRGLWSAMEVTSSGEVLVAYYDVLEGGLGLARSTSDGSSFSYEGVDGFTYTTDSGLPVNPGDRGLYLDMALDSGDVPHFSYYDKDEGALRYATADGDEWASTAVDGTIGSADVGTFTSIAIDGSGNPGIAYYDIREMALKFAYLDGGWSKETVDEGELTADGIDAGAEEPDVGQYTHLVHQDGSWWIAYYDVANGDLKLAYGTPGNWTIETLAGAGDGDKGAWPYLHPTANAGVFRVAFHDVGEQDLLVGRYTGGVLEYGVVDDAPFVGADAVIADIGGGIRVHYFDGYNNDVKQAIEQQDGGWVVSTLIADGAVGFSNNLVFQGGSMYTCSFSYTEGDFRFESIAP